MSGFGRRVDLGQCVMRPTAQLQAMRLGQIVEPRDGLAERSHVAGGEVSMRIVEAPNLPGRWLVAIVEQWGDRHEVLWAHHAPTATQASEIGLPQLEMILRARKV